MTASTIHFHDSIDGDADEVRRLALLDSSRPLHGDVVLASIDGEPVAAMSREDRRTVADPFVRTAAILEMLRAYVRSPLRLA
jgi:hypothetical protein